MKYYLFILLAIILFSCDKLPHADLRGVKIEKKNVKLQKVSKGEILKKAITLGEQAIESQKARLVKSVNDPDLLPVEKEIFEAYRVAAAEQYKDSNVQFFNDDKNVLFNLPYYQGDTLIGVYSVKLSTAEVIKSLQRKF